MDDEAGVFVERKDLAETVQRGLGQDIEMARKCQHAKKFDMNRALY
ncbi:MAG TPA: hypothetical protein VK632_01705 [Verrucomicrobiae bacterium]|nr:hypothetical protein [Verrucomicrobiae bacterium]